MPDTTPSRKNKSRFTFLKALFRRDSKTKSFPAASGEDSGPKERRNSENNDAQVSGTSPHDHMNPIDTTSSLDEPAPQPLSRPSSSHRAVNEEYSTAAIHRTSSDSHPLGTDAPSEMKFFGNIDLPGDGKSQPTSTSFDLQLLHLKPSPASSLDLVPQLKQHQHQHGTSLASIPDSPLDPFGYRSPPPSGPAETLDLSSLPTPTTPSQYASTMSTLYAGYKSVQVQKFTAESEAATHFAAYQTAQQRMGEVGLQYEAITRRVYQLLESAKQADVQLEVPEEFKSPPAPTSPTPVRTSIALSTTPATYGCSSFEEENDTVGPLPFNKGRRPLMADNAM